MIPEEALRKAVKADGRTRHAIAVAAAMARPNLDRFMVPGASLRFGTGVRLARAVGFKMDPKEGPGDE